MFNFAQRMIKEACDSGLAVTVKDAEGFLYRGRSSFKAWEAVQSQKEAFVTFNSDEGVRQWMHVSAYIEPHESIIDYSGAWVGRRWVRFDLEAMSSAA
jgi:hypothetical protein